MRFADIPGQESAKAAVLGALAGGRLAHALLLIGPEGTGKLAFALALARRLFCASPAEDGDCCGVCNDCRKVAAGGHPDVHYVFPYARSHDSKASNDDVRIAFRDAVRKNPFLTLKQWAASFDAENKQLVIGVDEARALKRALSLSSYEGKGKTIVVWRADLFNTSAANALLKLLEEPTDRTTFVLTAENPADVLPTIHSRCQKLTFRPVRAE
ncbi:MAG: AAA family ATPase, partial [Bacteroidia bacterium]|nr:AAA family ATPase [Bacteroidia bacterium]MDW8334395.1 AAA family ATPase [Bacteroidia bacterium]